MRGEPIRLAIDELEIFAYATNVSILGPKEEAYRVRAAMERELAFRNAYLTWNEEAQGFEDDLLRIHQSADGDVCAACGGGSTRCRRGSTWPASTSRSGTSCIG